MIRGKKRRKSGRKLQKHKRHYATAGWSNALQGQPAFVIGTSPGLDRYDLKPVSKFFSIGINRAFLRIDPTILLWQDISLWNTEHKKLMDLQAIRLCRDIADAKNLHYHFSLKGSKYRFDTMDTHLLYGRGSSGPLAVQLAVSLGCDPIILLGMDCKKQGNKTDFYGKNKFWLPHTLSNCQKGLIAVKKRCKSNLYFCGRNELWPESQLDQVLSELEEQGHTPKGRQWYAQKILKSSTS